MGGIIGSLEITKKDTFTFKLFKNKGTVLNNSTSSDSGATGGLIGSSYSTEGSTINISYALNMSNVTSNAAADTGGTIGAWTGSGTGNMTYVSTNLDESYQPYLVSGTENVGGSIGRMETGSVTFIDSYNYNTVQGTGNNVGGIVGNLKQGVLKGGINNYGNVTGATAVGGIAGLNELGTITYNGGAYLTNSGTVTSTDTAVLDTSGYGYGGGMAGGIVGKNDGKVSYVINEGAVSGSAAVGGIVGYNTSFGELKQSVNSATVTSTGTNAEGTGGVAGYSNGSISTSMNIGTVSGVNSVGGVVGMNSYYQRSAVNEEAKTTWYEALASEVDTVYNTGAVSGSGENVGGVIGLGTGGNYTNVYNTGTVSGSTNVGGLIGKAVATTLVEDVVENHNPYPPTGDTVTTVAKNTITNTYNTGAVTGTTVGGLVGSTDTGTIVNSSFYATTNAAGTAINGTNDSGLGTAKTLEQMKQAALYADWDLDSTGGQDKVWRIYQGGTTPLLKNWLTKVTVSGLSNQSVVYDGAAHAPDVTGVTYNPEYLDLELIKTVSGTAAGSYAMLYSTQDGYDLVNDPTFTISKAVLKFVDLNTAAPADYTYGASVAPVIDWNFTGFTGGDTYETAAKSGSVSFDTSAAFSNGKTANAGTYSYSYNGDLVFDNYKFTTDTEGHGAGSIKVNQASLTVAAGAATGNGVYGSDPTGQLGYAVSGLKYDDTAAVLSGTPTYTTAAWNSTTGKTGNAGTYSDVVLTALGTLTATNYKLTADSVTTGSITLDKVAATVTPNTIGNVVYGNTTGITANYDYTITGLVNGDSSAAGLTGAPTYTTEAVNGTKTNNVGTYDLTAATGTLASTNYSFSGATKADAITITKATVTVSATNVAHDVTYGDTDIASNFGYSVNGLVNGDTATVISGAPTYTTTAWNGTKTGNAGTYTDITASGQGSLSAANYEFAIDTTKQGSVTITPANLTLTADKVTMRDGDVLPSSFGGSVSGYVNGDSAIDMPLFVYDGSGTPAVGTHGILGYLGGKSSGLYGTNYYILQGAGNASALTVTSRIGSTDYARAISSLVPRHGNQIVTSLYGIWVSQPASTVEAREVGGSRLELAAGYYVDLDNKRHYL